MSESYERAQVWLERSRPDLAEPELRRALADDPEHGDAHTLLGLCLILQGKHEDGLVEAERGCSLEPDQELPLYVRAEALIGLDREAEAEKAARAALEVNPEFVPAYSALSRALGGMRKWKAAREAAEDGLELDPESTDCANDRAVALIQLGEGEQADFSLQAALQSDPSDPRTHANLGYAALHRGAAQEAITHYREALRLDPSDEHSRSGLVEALKSRNLIYRLFLKFFLALTRIPAWLVLALLIGSVVLRSTLSSLAEEYPAWSPLLMSVFWIVVAFVLMTWIAVPLFNLVLRADRDGRHALRPEQVRVTNCLLGMLFLTGVAAALWAAGVPAMGRAAFCLGLLTLPILAFASSSPGRKRMIAGAFSLGLLVAGAGAVAADTGVTDDPRMRELIGRLAPEQLKKPVGQLLRDRPDSLTKEEWDELETAINRFAREKSARTWRDRFFNVFVWGFVAFTWLGGAAIGTGRRD